MPPTPTHPPTPPPHLIADAHALALAPLPLTPAPERRAITAAITTTRARLGGPDGVTAVLAGEYGRHQEETAARVRAAYAVLSAVICQVCGAGGNMVGYACHRCGNMVVGRVQRSRAPGARMPAGAIYVGRPTRWANPYPVSTYGRTLAVTLYRLHLASRPELLNAARHELAGRALACWCPLDGRPCHADVLLTIANPTTSTPTDPAPTQVHA
jgi:predicted RNA-binding Zn-ribbon protein involved in translation (DUF1610 family)